MRRVVELSVKSLLAKGAEAEVYAGTFLSLPVVVKKRIPKPYRVKALDERLRFSRTLAEARMLFRAKRAGVPCPYVLAVFSDTLVLSRIEGRRPELSEMLAEWMGEQLGRLHNAGIVHGDFTPANILESGGNFYVIDFGLAFFSQRDEDFAADLLVLKKSLPESLAERAISAYARLGRKEVLKRLAEIEQRGRYK